MSKFLIDKNDEEKRLYAKKSLGQNFLNSEKALNQIVEAGDINSDDNILEIGPGIVVGTLSAPSGL